jgi:hypothetical protein
MARALSLDDIIDFLRKRGRRLSSGSHAHLVGYLAYQLDAGLQQDRVRLLIVEGEQCGLLKVQRGSALRVDSLSLAEWHDADIEIEEVPSESEAWETAISLRQQLAQLREELQAAHAALPVVVEVPVSTKMVAEASPCDCESLRRQLIAKDGVIAGLRTELATSQQRESIASQRATRLHAELAPWRSHVCQAEGVPLTVMSCGCTLVRDARRCNGSSDSVLAIIDNRRVPRKLRSAVKEAHGVPMTVLQG